MDIKPGDWVRFYQGGRLVIGLVQYVRVIPCWSYGGIEICTDVGATNEVLEVRSPAPVQEEPRNAE